MSRFEGFYVALQFVELAVGSPDENNRFIDLVFWAQHGSAPGRRGFEAGTWRPEMPLGLRIRHIHCKTDSLPARLDI
jgi:hypothetical protein